METININNLPIGNSADYTFKGLYRTIAPLTSTVVINSPAPPNVLRFIYATLISNVTPSISSAVAVLVKNYSVLISPFPADANVLFLSPGFVDDNTAVN